MMINLTDFDNYTIAINAEQIAALKTERSGTLVVLANGEKYSVRERLKDCLNKIDSAGRAREPVYVPREADLVDEGYQEPKHISRPAAQVNEF